MDTRDDDNPFTVRPTGPPVAGRVIRTLVVLIVCAGGAYGLHWASGRWLISRLAAGLERHPPHVQLERLTMLSEFGSAGMPALVGAVASEEERLSTAALGVLAEMHGRLRMTGGPERERCQAALVAAVEQVIPECPPNRVRRLASLLDPVVLDTVESDSAEDQEIYRRASTLLAKVLRPAGGDPTPRIARPAPTRPLSPEADEAFYGRSTLPPLPAAIAEAELGDDSPRAGAGDPLPSFPEADQLRSPAGNAQAQPPGAPRAPSAQPTLVEVSQGAVAVKQLSSLEYVTDNPLAAYDTRSVVGFVASVQPHLREAAEKELLSRGFTHGDLEMARRLMASDARTRLAMMDELATRSDLDPRRWLIWLASDAERDVRLEAISRLGTMDDPKVQAALRDLLREERDPTVATRLRRFLGLR